MRQRYLTWSAVVMSLIIFLACVVFGLGQGG
jgi:uncharacterized membrane protein